jgi:hypothetical protein
MAGRHPLDRMSELPVAGTDGMLDKDHQRPGDCLPALGEGRLGRRKVHPAETLHPAQVMDTVHKGHSSQARHADRMDAPIRLWILKTCTTHAQLTGRAGLVRLGARSVVGAGDGIIVTLIAFVSGG